MAKRAAAPKPRKRPERSYDAFEASLRQWCVEAAMRWPVTTERTTPLYNDMQRFAGGMGGHIVEKTVEADIISRARKLLEFVKGA